MKNPSRSSLLVRCSLGLALASFSWTALPAQTASDPPTPAKKTMMGNKMMEPGQAGLGGPPAQSMPMHDQKMLNDMPTRDDELAAQVAAMNQAPADQKLELMAAIITRMAVQSATMHARMGAMQGEMRNGAMRRMPMNDSAPETPMTLNPAGAERNLGEPQS